MVVCAVFGCSNRTERDKVSFYRIPCVNMKRNYKNSALLLQRQKLWIIRLRRVFDEKKMRHVRICSLHFISGKPSSLEDVTNPDWAPSINLGYGQTGNDTASLQKYQRTQPMLHHLSVLKLEKKDEKEGRIDHLKSEVLNTAPCSTSQDSDILDSNNEANDSDVVNSNMNPTISSASPGKKDASTSTDLTFQKLTHLEELARDYYSLKIRYYSLKKKIAIDFAKANLKRMHAIQ